MPSVRWVPLAREETYCSSPSTFAKGLLLMRSCSSLIGFREIGLRNQRRRKTLDRIIAETSTASCQDLHPQPVPVLSCAGEERSCLLLCRKPFSVFWRGSLNICFAH